MTLDEPHMTWPNSIPAEALAYGDAYIEEHAQAYDAIIPGLGEALRACWAIVRPQPMCDCPLDPHHRWNCHLTPIWAQTMRDLDTNPWTVITHSLIYCDLSFPPVGINR